MYIHMRSLPIQAELRVFKVIKLDVATDLDVLQTQSQMVFS